ncbi:MAG: cold shock domain-containing protein, partial [Rhodothermales bacterium]
MQNSSTDPKGEHVGRVKFFDGEKGFGFIGDFDAEADVFVHVSNVIADEPLRSGDVVRFAVAPSRRKKSEEARGVTRLSGEEAAKLSAKYKALAPDLRLGRVKFFDSRKGFGFIHDFSEAVDIYVGASEVKGTVRDRDLVVFERRPSPRKRGTDEACDVCSIEDFRGEKLALLSSIELSGKIWSEEVRMLIPHLDELEMAELAERTVRSQIPLGVDAAKALLDATLSATQSGYVLFRSLPRSSSDRLRLIRTHTQPGLYEAVLHAVEVAVPIEARFRLFLDGFTDSFSEDVARSAAGDLERSDLLRLLDQELATEDLKVDLLSAYADQLISEADSDNIQGVVWTLRQSRK